MSLVIGGTGMLIDATAWLSKRSDVTLLVARRASQAARKLSNTIPLDADWNGPAFKRELTTTLAALEPISEALLWLRDPETVLAWLLPFLPEAQIVIALGSMDGMPASPPAHTNVAFVRLGSKAVPGGRRWLTNAEISTGAIAALNDGSSRVIGDLQPIR